MPGIATVSLVNVPLPTLSLTTTEDTYTITLGRNYSVASPLCLRFASDTASHLMSLSSGGPYTLNTNTWPSAFNFTGKTGDVITLYVKALSGTPTLYLCPIDPECNL